MNTSKKSPLVNLDKLEQTLEQLLVEAKTTKLPNAYVGDIVEMRKVIKMMRANRG